MNRYRVGQTVRCVATLLDFDDQPITALPTIRLLTQGPGDAHSTESSATATGTPGEVAGYFIPDRPGRWRYRFETSSGFAANEEAAVDVFAREVAAPA